MNFSQLFAADPSVETPYEQSKRDKIRKVLKHRFEETSKKYTPLAVMLYGSQNYGLDTSQSDIDTKTILVPTLRDIAYNKRPVSTAVEQDEFGLNDLKDFRLMFDCYKKQNVNFVETLFTSHFYYNPLFLPQWNLLQEKAEKIAQYNDFATINCMVGMMKEKQHALCHPYPSKLDLIEKYGYDAKQLAHALRLKEMLVRYLSGVESYYLILKSNKKDFLSKVRSYEFTLEQAKQMMDEAVLFANATKNKYIADVKTPHINKDVERFFQQLSHSILETQFRKELFTQ